MTTDLDILKRRDPVCEIASRAAMVDAGISWLFDLLKSSAWGEKKSSRLLGLKRERRCSKHRTSRSGKTGHR